MVVQGADVLIKDINFYHSDVQYSNTIGIASARIDSTNHRFYKAPDADGFGPTVKAFSPTRVTLENVGLEQMNIAWWNGGEHNESNNDFVRWRNVSVYGSPIGFRNFNKQGMGHVFEQVTHGGVNGQKVFQFIEGGDSEFRDCYVGYNDNVHFLELAKGPSGGPTTNNGYFEINKVKWDSQANNTYAVYMLDATELDALWATEFPMSTLLMAIAAPSRMTVS